MLVTGPTGSGKTTTLYSSLIEIKDEDTKIITTEDPVEYQLEGINQIQVHPKIGLTFAASLRIILRHDPDVVLVGEIRDLETAENAIQASLTGHLVFSTLHTNDAAERLHAADRHGRRAVPGGQHGRSRDGPAAGAHAVHEVPRAVRAEARRPAQGLSLGRVSRSAASRCIGRRAAARAGSSASSAGRAFSSCASRPTPSANWPTTAPAAGKSARPPATTACGRSAKTPG